MLDSSNRDSLVTPTPVSPGSRRVRVPDPSRTTCSRPATRSVVVVSNYSQYGSVTNTTTPTANVTGDTKRSKVILPVVGGYTAALASGAFGTPLDEILANVTGVGPGKSLANSVKVIQAKAASGNAQATCDSINPFVNEVQAQSGKTLATAQADLLIAEATQTAELLAC